MKIKKYTKKNGDTAYRFRLYLGREDGKDKYIKRSGFKSIAEARQAIFRLQAELKEQHNKKMTFADLYAEWLPSYEKDVAESTAMKTRRNFGNHILPAIGAWDITTIKPMTLQKEADKWSLKLKYARKLVGMVKTVFDYGILHEYLESNPASAVKATKIKRELGIKKDFYNKDELKRFLQLADTTNNIRLIACFRVLAFTGIRIGELQALEWTDIADNTLSINKAVTRTPAGLEIGATKTASSKRLISLDDKTLEILERLHAENQHNLIFSDENGHIITPTLPRKWLLQVVKESDLQPIRIHGFRHTHASLLFDAGMSLKQVQYRLGHSNLKTTMDVYTHITESAKDDIASKFSDYLDF